MEKYITKDEFLKEKGIDLSIELKNTDNESDKCERLIKEVTDWCCDYLISQYGANELNEDVTPWVELAEWRQKRFRKGVIEQIDYILSNGLLTKDSGYNRDTHTILSLNNIVLCSDAYRQFFLGAFCNV